MLSFHVVDEQVSLTLYSPVKPVLFIQGITFTFYVYMIDFFNESQLRIALGTVFCYKLSFVLSLWVPLGSLWVHWLSWGKCVLGKFLNILTIIDERGSNAMATPPIIDNTYDNR